MECNCDWSIPYWCRQMWENWTSMSSRRVHLVGRVMNWSEPDGSVELGRAVEKKKGISLKPIEFQHQSIQISCSLSKKIHPIEITSCLFLWSTSQNFKKHHNRNRTHLFYTPKNTHQKSLGFFVLKDLLERGNASVGDALAFPLHWSPKGQPQASSPLIRVLSKW